jgi:hypothetical protein
MGACCDECAASGGTCASGAVKSVMAQNQTLATRGRLFLRPGGQTEINKSTDATKAAAIGDTVDALAARLHDSWMPDSVDKYNMLIDCLRTPPNAAAPRSECIPALQFIASHCRYYTPTPGGPTTVICEPLHSGEPWLDVATWMQRNWDRMTPGYQAAAPADSQSLSVQGTGTGSSPPAGSQPIVLPTPTQPSPSNVPDAMVPIAPPIPGPMVQTTTAPAPVVDAAAAASRRNKFLAVGALAIVIAGGGIYAYRTMSKKSSRRK